jgi:hypothetical protein
VRRGFGSTLIEQSARGEGGDARMLVDADGLSWEITLPLPRTQSVLPRTVAAGMIDNNQASPEKWRLVENHRARFAGKRFLVVEDEPLVALDARHLNTGQLDTFVVEHGHLAPLWRYSLSSAPKHP